MGKKANQEPLPGMEARDVPEIEQAADHYRQIRDERCALSKKEAEAKAALIQVMKNKGRAYYSYNGLNVQLSNQENVKVKAKDEDDEEPTGTFRQTKREVKQSAEGLIEEAEEMIEQQQQQAEASREAVGEFFDTDPPAEEAETEEDRAKYWAEWRANLSADEEMQFMNAPCSCGDIRVMHAGDENDGQCSDPHCECLRYECADCKTKGGHQAACEHYVLGEGTPVQKEEEADDFTAPRCDECGRIDGAHTKECSHSPDLRFSDYLAYAEAHYKKNHQSHARKMELTRLKDEEVREWKQQQASNSVEPEPAKKSAKLSLVEAAIDR